MASTYSILSEIPQGWKASLNTVSEEGGITLLHLHLQAQSELTPPKMQLGMSIPLTDMDIYWTPSGEAAQNIMPEWGGSFQSSIAHRAPLFSFISNSDRNRITVAASDALRTIKFTNGVREFDSTLTLKMNLFTSPEASNVISWQRWAMI